MLITDRTPSQLKLLFRQWTRSAVAELIRLPFHVGLVECFVRPHLACEAVTPQKLMKRAYKQSPAWAKK